CENTRIALMSGLNNDRNFLHCKRQHASDITFGDAFQRAGYATGIFGKWKQTRGTKEIPGKDYIFEFGWDEFCCFDVVGEGQRFINPNLVINGEIHNYMGRTDLDPETGRRWYGPDICNRYALDFIEKNKDRKFFLYYPMMLVHDEHKPTPDTKPDSLFDNFDEVTHNRDGHSGDDHRYFPDMLSYTDKLIGNIVDKLEENGLTENTLIVIMGDNGTKEAFTHTLRDGSIYPGRKGGNADNGLHVPLILKMPSAIPSGEDVRTYEGLVNLTDIYPTIADAAGVKVPGRDKLDGISFWPQMTGENTSEHRDVIYTWYNGNNHYQNEETILRYAFNKEFKRYAPSHNYPEDRFFDLRTDPLERGGESFVKLRFSVLRYSGLNTDSLTPEQQEAYDELGRILVQHEYVPVEELKIISETTELNVGERTVIKCDVLPENATRFGTIWESSDPGIASIDKFGEITAHKKGEVFIKVFSWDDAYPTSNNQDSTYFTSGIQNSIALTVH
ncbi:sulfatase-like hydrolase/transferase, partial [Bacteroidota bacterium]